MRTGCEARPHPATMCIPPLPLLWKKRPLAEPCGRPFWRAFSELDLHASRNIPSVDFVFGKSSACLSTEESKRLIRDVQPGKEYVDVVRKLVAGLEIQLPAFVEVQILRFVVAQRIEVGAVIRVGEPCLEAATLVEQCSIPDVVGLQEERYFFGAI